MRHKEINIEKRFYGYYVDAILLDDLVLKHIIVDSKQYKDLIYVFRYMFKKSHWNQWRISMN